MSCSVAATCHCPSIRLCSRLRPDRMCPSALNGHYAGVMCYHVTHNYIWLATPGWFQSFCRRFFLFCLSCQSALEPNPLTEEDFAGFYSCIELYGVHNLEISRVILERWCLCRNSKQKEIVPHLHCKCESQIQTLKKGDWNQTDPERPKGILYQGDFIFPAS